MKLYNTRFSAKNPVDKWSFSMERLLRACKLNLVGEASLVARLHTSCFSRKESNCLNKAGGGAGEDEADKMFTVG